jgi:3-dehydroquinate synthetase
VSEPDHEFPPLRSVRDRPHRVTLTHGLLHPDNTRLRECVRHRTALVVTSPTVDRLYGRRIRAYFGPIPGVHYSVLHRGEATKSIDAAVEISERASAAGLCRTSPVIAFGGGVCTDICGLAAALHHRGIPHIKVPTTLIGLVDAGIGMKNAVNHDGRKSVLGSFHPPEHSLLDPGFLGTLPRRHLSSGLAEIIKLAVVADGDLFDLVEASARAMLDSGFRAPAEVVTAVVRRSVAGMLAELARNPYEVTDFRRKVDFGHTFSPWLETASQHTVLHGEAVALDIALSTELAADLGLITAAERERVLDLLRCSGLPLSWPATSVDGLWASLRSVVDHRNGDLHLVVPTAIGDCTFVEARAISPGLLRACLDRLGRHDSTARPDRLSGVRA